MNVNQANIVGRVTRDPELKKLPSGTSVVSFSLATNYTYKDKDNNKQEEVEFHNCKAFGPKADTIGQYVTKGQLLFVEGRLKTSSWDDESSGKKMYRTEIMVNNFQFGPRAGDAPKASADEGDDYPDEINPEDIPF